MWDVLHLIDTLVQTNQGVMHYDDQMVLKEMVAMLLGTDVRSKLSMIHYHSCHHKSIPGTDFFLLLFPIMWNQSLSENCSADMNESCPDILSPMAAGRARAMAAPVTRPGSWAVVLAALHAATPEPPDGEPFPAPRSLPRRNEKRAVEKREMAPPRRP